MGCVAARRSSRNRTRTNFASDEWGPWFPMSRRLARSRSRSRGEVLAPGESAPMKIAMAQFESFDDRVEVNGQTVAAVLDAMQGFTESARRFLAKSGIGDPLADAWYPQQAWLDAFREISETIGPTTLRAIGRSIPDNAAFPPGIDGIVAALASIDVAYHMNHRIEGTPLFDPRTGAMREGIGHYAVEQPGPSEVIVRCANPYPCDFDYGIVDAMSRRFKPKGSRVVIEHVEGECRKAGAERCNYRVRW